ncbi:MAG: glycosyltransferase family 2 protein [Clostridia bacterium]|nr:glycosyltransferase family 2 protein [Clostridia bacterium]
MAKILWMLIPCYNEEKVLVHTAPVFLKQLNHLIDMDLVSDESKILFIDDGSKDSTWSIIKKLSEEDSHFIGIRQSRNRGHQNSLLAGLMQAKDEADITISMDCDGQDDILATEQMIKEYYNGNEVVYAVRSSRETDTFFKKFTAESFYKILKTMGAEVVFNHADYRLVSSKVLKNLSDFKEVNLFLRGMIPLIGYKSTVVAYERKQRVAGDTHYPLSKMLTLAFDGITSLSTKPIRLITILGLIVTLFSIVGIIWSVVTYLTGNAVAGWASMTALICFMGGVQLASIGVIGEYIGKIYMEVKARPRYIISEYTWKE